MNTLQEIAASLLEAATDSRTGTVKLTEVIADLSEYSLTGKHSELELNELLDILKLPIME